MGPERDIIKLSAAMRLGIWVVEDITLGELEVQAVEIEVTQACTTMVTIHIKLTKLQSESSIWDVTEVHWIAIAE